MVAVTFFNPATDQRLQVDELDELMTVKEAVDNLVDQRFIPAPTGDHHYRLDIKGKTTLTRDEATLASGGLTSGDLVSVVGQQRGGC
jgi:hypothetical protein